MITDEQLNKWRDMLDAATTGPWAIEVGHYYGKNWLVGSIWYGTDAEDDKDYWVHITTDHVHASQLSGSARADAEFTVAARNEIVPALLVEVERLRAELDNLHSEIRAGAEERDLVE